MAIMKRVPGPDPARGGTGVPDRDAPDRADGPAASPAGLGKERIPVTPQRWPNSQVTSAKSIRRLLLSSRAAISTYIADYRHLVDAPPALLDERELGAAAHAAPPVAGPVRPPRWYRGGVEGP
jgi:hypothetical protein